MRHGSIYFKVVKQNGDDIGMFRVKPSQTVGAEFNAFLTRHFEVDCSSRHLGDEWFIVFPVVYNVQRVEVTREDFFKRYPWMRD